MREIRSMNELIDICTRDQKTIGEIMLLMEIESNSYGVKFF